MNLAQTAHTAALDFPVRPLSALLPTLLAEAAQLLERDLDAARALLHRALVLLEPPAQPVHGCLAAWQARRVADHIERRLDSALRLEELARVAGLSCSYFSRAFKATFAEAPHAFILRQRVARAQTLMLGSTEPLARIAAACGFADQAHLSRAFRRHVGAPPHAWRRAHTPEPCFRN